MGKNQIPAGPVNSSWNMGRTRRLRVRRENTATEGQILRAPSTDDLLLIQDQRRATRAGTYSSSMSEVDVVKQFRGEEQNDPVAYGFMCKNCNGVHASFSCPEPEYRPRARMSAKARRRAAKRRQQP